MYLYHYYDKKRPPFLTLSDLSDEEAKFAQDELKRDGNVYDKRDYDGRYLASRRIVEENVRKTFIEKGGRPVRKNPVYSILGESHEKIYPEYKMWFEEPAYIEIPIDESVAALVSFTYGDSFIVNHPDYHDQTKYGERVLTYMEVLALITEKGWPQDKVTEDPPFWLPTYIEAQIWDDELINRYK